MAKIVQVTDFVGKYKLTQNNLQTSNLQAFIDKYELKYLRELLGVSLSDLLLADITVNFQTPNTQKYIDIYNAFAYDKTDIFCRQYSSNGMKEMLLGLIYFEYIKDNNTIHTMTGVVKAQNEASTQASFEETNAYSNYNEAIKSYRAIQQYITLNSSIYPEYNGISKFYNHWSI